MLGPWPKSKCAGSITPSCSGATVAVVNRLPLGAHLLPDGRLWPLFTFRDWAFFGPAADKVGLGVSLNSLQGVWQAGLPGKRKEKKGKKRKKRGAGRRDRSGRDHVPLTARGRICKSTLSLANPSKTGGPAKGRDCTVITAV